MPEDFEKKEVTAKIIRAAMNVHNELGPHYLEVIYQRALAIELTRFDLEFTRETDIPIYYRGEKIDTRRADFIVDDVLVEIKAKTELENKDHEQILSYLKSSGYRVGMLINFGGKKLEFIRKANRGGNV